MSHTVKYQAPQLKRLDMVEAAFKRLGWTPKRDATIRTWSAAEAKVVYPLVGVNPRPTGFDVGVRSEAGGCSLHADVSMDDSIHEDLGLNYERVSQAYTLSEIDEMAAANGGYTTCENNSDGTVEMTVTMEVSV